MNEESIVQSIFQNRLVKHDELRWLEQSVEDGKLRQKVIIALEEFCGEVSQIDTYSFLCQLLKSLTHVSRYEIEGLRSLYEIASNIKLRMDTVLLSARQSLNNLIVWSNLPLWIDMTSQLVESDSKILEIILDELCLIGRNQSDYTLGMSVSQIRELSKVIRILSILTAMKSLKLGKDMVDSYLQAISSQYHIEDILSGKRKESYLGHVDNLLNLLTQQYHIHIDINKGIYYRPEIRKNQLSYVLVESSKESIGRSVFLDLLYSCALMPIRQYKSQTKKSAPVVLRCICGKIIEKWRLIGLPAEDESNLMRKLEQSRLLSAPDRFACDSHKQKITSLLCELCYRSLFLEMSGDVEHVGVGCSPCFSRQASAINSLKSPSIDEQDIMTPQHSKFIPIESPPKPVRSSYRSERDEEASVLSAVSKVEINDDDTSVASKQDSHKLQAQQNDIPRLSDAEFLVFMCSLLGGIPITLVYSYEPLVEKTRLLYLCSNDDEVSTALRTKLSSSSRSEGLDRAVYKWLAGKASCLYLGWAHLSEQKKLMYNDKKSLPLAEIKNIKVGSKRWKNCVKIGSVSVVIVVKVDHDEQFSILLRGLTQLIANLSSSHK